MAIEVIDIGDSVLCDWCNDDYTGKPDIGGFLFQSKATCPKCAPRIEAGAKKYDEAHFITAHCPEGTPFAAWVLSLRGGNNEVRILTDEDAIF